MVFDDGSHIRPCSNFGRRVSDRPIDADRKDRRRRGPSTACSTGRGSRASMCHALEDRVLQADRFNPPSSRDNVFINSNTRQPSNTRIARRTRESFREGHRHRQRYIYARSSSKEIGRKERWVLLL